MQDAAGRLLYSVMLGSTPIVESSRLGLMVNGRNLAQGASMSEAARYDVDETSFWPGVHSPAINRCSGARIAMRGWTLDARACDDGAAFRFIVPGDANVSRTPDEGTVFRFPDGSTIWSHDFEGHYEGMHEQRRIEDVTAGEWAAPPLTVRLRGSAAYASVTESALEGYSGLALRADTSWAHQNATAVVFTSPLLVYGGHPQSLLDSPAVELIKSVPSVWDETRVLAGSEIGEAAAFARRRGRDWFVGVLNGAEVRTFRLDLGFLEGGRYDALIVRDRADDAGAMAVEKKTATAQLTLTIALRPGGGFVARQTESAGQTPR